MAAKKTRRTSKVAKALPVKNLTVKQAKVVKGGGAKKHIAGVKY